VRERLCRKVGRNEIGKCFRGTELFAFSPRFCGCDPGNVEFGAAVFLGFGAFLRS
jgi:hypothetical protein